jgi:flagellar protein FlaG
MEIKNLTVGLPLPNPVLDNSSSSIPSAPETKKVAVPAAGAVTKNEKISNAEIEKAVEKSNSILSQRATGLEFSFDKDSGKTIVRLIDKETEEVLRQYPSKEMLAIAKELDKFQGSLVSTKV